MFSALKKFTKSGDDRCPPPKAMSSSLQKKFSRGVHYNMKILIKGDRNVGKSCLLQRLQGGAFTEEYVPTEQIQVAPIHWTYKSTDYIVKVEVWEVVDKGRTKKKPPLGLKLENQTPSSSLPEEEFETPVLDATFLDVYKNASGVILMLDITKPWTFEYVVKELARIPADLPVVILGNHCDMQHHRQVHPHHIEQALYHAKSVRTAPLRYAESSMRNGFGLRLLHKFLSIPFLRLQKTSLLEQLQRNQRDTEEIEKELDDFQNSEESQYNLFVDRLANKRRQSTECEPKINDRSPSIVLGAGKPIMPPNVNPLLAQSLQPTVIQSESNVPEKQIRQTQYVSPELMKNKSHVSMDMTPSKVPHQDSIPSTPSGNNVSMSGSSGALEEFYAGALDSSFLEDLTPMTNANQEVDFESESDDENTANPKVIIDEDDLDIEYTPPVQTTRAVVTKPRTESKYIKDDTLSNMFLTKAVIEKSDDFDIDHAQGDIHGDYPMWIERDSSTRQSPEGGEDPDGMKESALKPEKKHKKKKSKDKEKGDYCDKTEQKEKKHKRKKSKSEKTSHPQNDLLASVASTDFNYEEYDSI